jgi:uncharacterized protein (TIGR00369 family)
MARTARNKRRTMAVATHADRFAPLAPDRLRAWDRFGRREGDAPPFFPGYVGLVLEEVRQDYARMRLPHRRELDQAQGVMHGGALATLVDTVVVPAIASVHAEPRPLLTIAMTMQYLAPVAGEDAVAEGWVERRGRSTCFCRVEVRSASGELAVTASVVYKVSGRTIPIPS